MAQPRRPRLGSTALAAIPLLLAILIAACAGSNGDESGVPAANPTTSETAKSATSDSEPPAEPAAASTTTEPEIEPVTYAGDFATSIEPIFADRCAACHSPGGPGTGHWVLETAADIVESHEALSTVVATGFMPPWPAGGDSLAFHEDRSLRPDQIQAIVDWSADGAPLDVAPDTAIEPRSPVFHLQDTDLTVTADQPYAGSVDVTDDYRCQIYDPELPDGGWITAYEFLPDETEVVHHAIGYLLPASARAAAIERDGADGSPGWQCYGSSGLGEDDIFLGWAPGQAPAEMPDGTGLEVDPGGFIVVQIHYHYETAAPPDHSALALRIADGGDLQSITVAEYLAPAEIPCATGEEGPLCDRDAALADAEARFGREGVLADQLMALCGYRSDDFAAMTDGDATSSCDLSASFAGGTGEIIGILGHMHEIGSWFKITLNPGTPEERVLLEIPDWDFDWQYNYAPIEQIVLDGNDVIRIECGWDRARRDPELAPAYVLWADGTNDEMCFATITTRPPT